MEKIPLRHAYEDLSRAKAAHERMLQASTASAIEGHWRDFLVAANTIFTKLERASERDPNARTWFNTIKQQRASDELLTYLLHARNSSEHGITEIARREFGVRISGGMGGGRIYGIAINERGEIQEDPRNTGNFNYQITTSIQLVPVLDRGVTYPVPTTHLGNPIAAPGPDVLCTLAIEYLDRLVRTASGFRPAT